MHIDNKEETYISKELLWIIYTLLPHLLVLLHTGDEGLGAIWSQKTLRDWVNRVSLIALCHVWLEIRNEKREKKKRSQNAERKKKLIYAREEA